MESSRSPAAFSCSRRLRLHSQEFVLPGKTNPAPFPLLPQSPFHKGKPQTQIICLKQRGQNTYKYAIFMAICAIQTRPSPFSKLSNQDKIKKNMTHFSGLAQGLQLCYASVVRSRQEDAAFVTKRRLFRGLRDETGDSYVNAFCWVQARISSRSSSAFAVRHAWLEKLSGANPSPSFASPVSSRIFRHFDGDPSRFVG